MISYKISVVKDGLCIILFHYMNSGAGEGWRRKVGPIM
jgi:hypothetical protein